MAGKKLYILKICRQKRDNTINLINSRDAHMTSLSNPETKVTTQYILK